MARKILLALLILVVTIPIMLLIGNASLPWLDGDGGKAEGAIAAGAEVEEAAAVVEAFYRWYLGYPGNPFAERAYRQSPLLSEAFVAQTDTEIEAMIAAGPGGADPILCAQDIPGDMRYGPAEVSSDRVGVIVEQIWNPDTEFEFVRELTVEVQQVEGEWLISDISCPVP